MERMAVFAARVLEIGLDGSGRRWARLTTPEGVRPAPGQYLSAWAQDQPAASLAETLYPAQYFPDGLRTAAPVPTSWAPGMTLQMRGPLGHGFRFFNPAHSGIENRPRRLALAALGDTSERLLPLAELALEAGSGVALFTDCPFPALPAVVEVYPLSDVQTALAWADALALDVPLDAFEQIPARLGLQPGGRFPCPTQALVTVKMPCAGLGECGVCAVQTSTGWLRLCESGPVLDLA
jgi:hypothetical protein